MNVKFGREKKTVGKKHWKSKELMMETKEESKKSSLYSFNRLSFNRFSTYAEPQSLLMTHFIKTDCLKMSLYSLMEIDEHSEYKKNEEKGA